MNLRSIAPNLEYEPSGYWSAPAQEVVSYPTAGNDFCFGVEERSFWFAHRNAAIVAAFRRWPPQSGAVLDVGAGNGFVAAALAAAGFPVVPVEPNPAGAANAVRRGLQHVVRGSLASAGFRAGSVAGIGLFDVLEHVPDESSFLAEARRCLMAGGRMYLTVPAYDVLWSAEDETGGHYRRYSKRQLRRTLEAAGFTAEYVTGLFWWLPLPIALLRALPYRLGARRQDSPRAAEHTLGGRALRTLATGSVRFEVSCVRRGWSFPFGGSLLAVARVDG